MEEIVSLNSRTVGLVSPLWIIMELVTMGFLNSQRREVGASVVIHLPGFRSSPLDDRIHTQQCLFPSIESGLLAYMEMSTRDKKKSPPPAPVSCLGS